MTTVENAFGEAQTIVLLGGTSEIGQAIVRRLVTPATTTVVLAARHPDAVGPFEAELHALGVATVDAVRYDAVDTAAQHDLARDLAERHGDIDVVVLAFGVLGDQATFDTDPVSAAEAATVNYVGGVGAGLAFADQLRRQGHGHLVVLSSVAGERVRKANFVYGSSKAGLDGFAQGLGDSLVGTGVSVLVVRPGFVRTRMTAGMKEAPLSTTPEGVAEVVAKGLAAGKRVVWAPPALRYLFSGLRHLPAPVWRRLPG